MRFKIGVVGMDAFKRALKKSGYKYRIRSGRMIAFRRTAWWGGRRFHLKADLCTGDEVFPETECEIHLDAEPDFRDGQKTRSGKHSYAVGGKLVNDEIRRIVKVLNIMKKEQQLIAKKEVTHKQSRKKGSSIVQTQGRMDELERKGRLTSHEKRSLKKYKERLERSKRR